MQPDLASMWMLPNVWQACMYASWELLPLLKADDDRPLSEHTFRWAALGTRRHLRTALTHVVLSLYPLKCLCWLGRESNTNSLEPGHNSHQSFTWGFCVTVWPVCGRVSRTEKKGPWVNRLKYNFFTSYSLGLTDATFVHLGSSSQRKGDRVVTYGQRPASLQPDSSSVREVSRERVLTIAKLLTLLVSKTPKSWEVVPILHLCWRFSSRQGSRIWNPVLIEIYWGTKGHRGFTESENVIEH